MKSLVSSPEKRLRNVRDAEKIIVHYQYSLRSCHLVFLLSGSKSGSIATVAPNGNSVPLAAVAEDPDPHFIDLPDAALSSSMMRDFFSNGI